MSGKTGGQAKYEVIRGGDTWPDEWLDWDSVDDAGHALWEGAVEAASQQQYPYLRSRIDSLTDRVAELVTEGSELSALVA